MKRKPPETRKTCLPLRSNRATSSRMPGVSTSSVLRCAMSSDTFSVLGWISSSRAASASWKGTSPPIALFVHAATAGPAPTNSASTSMPAHPSKRTQRKGPAIQSQLAHAFIPSSPSLQVPRTRRVAASSWLPAHYDSKEAGTFRIPSSLHTVLSTSKHTASASCSSCTTCSVGACWPSLVGTSAAEVDIKTLLLARSEFFERKRSDSC
eukprot:scaffold3352_cov326-Prasinococcus_capsulatus_cf.AAC.2